MSWEAWTPTNLEIGRVKSQLVCFRRNDILRILDSCKSKDSYSIDMMTNMLCMAMENAHWPQAKNLMYHDVDLRTN